MVVNLQSGHEIALQISKGNNSKNIQSRVIVFMCMTHRLIVLYNCMKFHFNSFNGCQVTERTRNSIANDQREITPIYPKQSYDSCAWHIVSLCATVVLSFNQIALTVFNLQSKHEIAFTYVTRSKIWKIYMQELWLLCMTRRLNTLYKWMKFRLNICNGYQVIERTQSCDHLCYKGDNLKNTHARVMVLLHDKSSQCASQMYEVSLKYL